MGEIDTSHACRSVPLGLSIRKGRWEVARGIKRTKTTKTTKTTKKDKTDRAREGWAAQRGGKPGDTWVLLQCCGFREQAN